MGSEHSTQLQQGTTNGPDGALRTGSLHRHSTSNPATSSSTASGRTGAAGSSGTGGSKLQRGNTIAVTGTTPSGGAGGILDDGYSTSSVTPSSAYICDSRPVSPPMSVCSDSDLPYISYTDKPIGDSPKLRNKQQSKQAKTRPNSAIIMNRASQQHHYQQHLTQNLEARGGIRGGRPATATTGGGAHSIVVVKSAAVRDVGIEKDDDIIRLQSVPMFLPVMRGTLTLPANRDPEVLERLQPTHLINMCSRLQSHFNTCAIHVSSEQQQITNRIKEVDQEVSSALAQLVQKQKLYTSYAETFSKVRQISQQLTRCNDILNQNIESMEYLNNLLSVEDRLEPFVWKTE
ncbi:BLOC-1-related complex subunit 5 [Anopheles maculipalpis]|uniref:BLOC-1-related complex subunit 5 n=1 Tax=Anopheles maculipalpis TaxID=1496333 RepID=UPI002159448D|nr:BLOC-1-related complex subunit 5 [Anopheles maculipalpis]